MTENNPSSTKKHFLCAGHLALVGFKEISLSIFCSIILLSLDYSLALPILAQIGEQANTNLVEL